MRILLDEDVAGIEGNGTVFCMTTGFPSQIERSRPWR